jgi:hypothetical protein
MFTFDADGSGDAYFDVPITLVGGENVAVRVPAGS